MNTTAHPDDSKRSRRTTMWTGTGLLLVIVLGMTLLARVEPLTTAVALGIAGLGAAGTLVMAWLMQRSSEYPRWAWWATAAVMCAALILSVPFAGDPVVWKEEFLVSAWMLPWFLLIMGSTRGAKAGMCAPASPRTGWTMVATGILLTVILLGARPIFNWLTGGRPLF